MTSRIRRTAVMSRSGSPSTATRSASRPGLISPRSVRWRMRALREVAEINTSGALMPARCMRRGNASVELGLRQSRARRLALAPMIIGVEFDDVGAGRNLVAHRSDGLIGPRDLLRALRNGNARFEALWPVSAARDDRLG